MCREKSCGAVIFQRQGELLTYLVLHSVLGHWTLCKGHVEGSETEHETALREIREETGSVRKVCGTLPRGHHLFPRSECDERCGVFFSGSGSR